MHPVLITRINCVLFAVLCVAAMLPIPGCDSNKPHAANRFYSSRPVDPSMSMPDSVVSYIHSAVDTIQKYSIYKDSIDWKSYRLKVLRDAHGAQTYTETYFAIEEALKGLGDHHSFLKSPKEHQRWTTGGSDHNFAFRRTDAVLLNNNIARIYIPRFSSGNPDLCLKYASDLQEMIKKLDEKKPIGWIVGLEYNSGGNMWPMLAGVGPLLTREGLQGNFRDSDGKYTPWIYEQGTAKLGEQVMLKIPKPYKLKNPNVPIAISVNDRTASSAEAILISFMGQSNTRVFGVPTAGLSTANGDYALRDGAHLILTSAVFTDWKGRIYGHKIQPDVKVSGLFYKFRNHASAPKEWILSINTK